MYCGTALKENHGSPSNSQCQIRNFFIKSGCFLKKHEPEVKPTNHPAVVPPSANQPVNYPLSVSRIRERKSGPAKTLSIIAVSTTVRAIGPSTAKLFQPAAQQ